MVKNGELKNEKILDFFKENYIINNQSDYNINFPLFFLDGLNLETVDNNFINKWIQINMISYVNYDIYNFCKIIVKKINKIEHFRILFKLFRNNDTNEIKIIKSFLSLRPDIIVIFTDKFKNLLNTYNKNKSNNFINDFCFLIDLIDFTNKKNSIVFLNNIIMNKLTFKEIKTQICQKLLCNPRLSINLNSFILFYFIRNINNLNNEIESIIRIKLKDKNYKPVIELIFNEINKLIIKEEEIFSKDKNIEFFILLKRIQELINCQGLVETGYINNILNLKNQIINNLKNGKIQYKLIHLWLNDYEKKNLLIERLNILSFKTLNQYEINDCFNCLEKYFSQINETVNYAKKLSKVLNVFFPIEQKKNIEFLDNYENKLKEGFLNEINKSLNGKEIDK